MYVDRNVYAFFLRISIFTLKAQMFDVNRMIQQNSWRNIVYNVLENKEKCSSQQIMSNAYFKFINKT